MFLKDHVIHHCLQLHGPVTWPIENEHRLGPRRPRGTDVKPCWIGASTHLQGTKAQGLDHQWIWKIWVDDGRYGKSLKIITICSGLSMILNDIVSDLKAISRFHMLSMHPPAELAQRQATSMGGASAAFTWAGLPWTNWWKKWWRSQILYTCYIHLHNIHMDTYGLIMIMIMIIIIHNGLGVQFSSVLNVLIHPHVLKRIASHCIPIRCHMISIWIDIPWHSHW